MFWFLHALCVLFCIPALIITVPLHLIYKALTVK